MKEFTPRAVLTGCAIGIVLAAANVISGLKTGWGDTSTITAAVLGFALMGSTRLTANPYTRLENNITQTLASSAAGMAFTCGTVGAIPALALSGHHFPGWAVALFGLAVGMLGMLVGALLRERLLVVEKLPFPSGIATAQVIEAMHRSTGDALTRARALMVSASVSAAIAWFRDGPLAWVPRAWAPSGEFKGQPWSTWTLGVEYSPLLIGTGMLVGPRIGLSLSIGALAAWAGGAPQLYAHHWAEASFESLAAWLLWPGVALMSGNALTSLLFQAPMLIRGLSDVARIDPHHSKWLWGVPLGLVILVVTLGAMVFAVPPGLTLSALLLSVVLSVVCARAAGETDILPSTQMGQLTQLAAGTVNQGVVPNLFSGQVVTAAVTQSSQMLWALKTGVLLNASVRAQMWAQFIGAVVGAVVVVPAFMVMSSVYGLGTQALPAPTALSWKALAEVVEHGSAALPFGAMPVVQCALALGVALALVERTRLSHLAPSAVAMSVGFLAPARFAITIAIGAFVGYGCEKKWPNTRVLQPPIAGGLVAGEALMGLAVAVWALIQR